MAYSEKLAKRIRERLADPLIRISHMYSWLRQINDGFVLTDNGHASFVKILEWLWGAIVLLPGARLIPANPPPIMTILFMAALYFSRNTYKYFILPFSNTATSIPVRAGGWLFGPTPQISLPILLLMITGFNLVKINSAGI